MRYIEIGKAVIEPGVVVIEETLPTIGAISQGGDG